MEYSNAMQILVNEHETILSVLDAVEAVAVGAAMQTAARSAGGWRSEESGCWRARGYAFGGWADRRRAYERKGEA